MLSGSEVFAKRIADCEAAISPYVDWSLTEVLQGGPHAPSLERVEVVQPALWAMMISLAAVWQSHGLHPDAVIGHSQGEVAAACVAGALSLDDGARVVVRRSQAIADLLAGSGGMLSVALPADRAQALVERRPGRLWTAAENGPRSVVLSGESDALDEVAAELAADGVRVRRVPVDYASHCPHVQVLHHRR